MSGLVTSLKATCKGNGRAPVNSTTVTYLLHRTLHETILYSFKFNITIIHVYAISIPVRVDP